MEKVLMPPLVQVVWIDSYSIDDWTDAARIADWKDWTNETTGYLVAATEDRVVIAHTLDMEGSKISSVCGQMVIPRIAVQSVKWITAG